VGEGVSGAAGGVSGADDLVVTVGLVLGEGGGLTVDLVGPGELEWVVEGRLEGWCDTGGCEGAVEAA
jgi:hypothetical protein